MRYKRIYGDFRRASSVRSRPEDGRVRVDGGGSRRGEWRATHVFSRWTKEIRSHEYISHYFTSRRLASVLRISHPLVENMYFLRITTTIFHLLQRCNSTYDPRAMVLFNLTRHSFRDVGDYGRDSLSARARRRLPPTHPPLPSPLPQIFSFEY